MIRNIHLSILSLLLILSVNPLFAQIPTPAFANRFGGGGSDYGYSMRTNPDGSSVLTGVFAASVTLAGVTYTSQGGNDAFICKTNAAGEVLWAKVLAGPDDQLFSQLAIDGQGSIVVVGEYKENASFAGTALTNSGNKDAVVAKLDANGTVTWIKTAANTADADFNEVATDAGGNVYAFGEFTETLTVGSITLTAAGSGQNANLCIVKYSPQGDVVWAKHYGNGFNGALAIWASPQGECTIAGTFLGSITFGTTTHATNGSSDIFLARLDANGDPAWSHTYGGSSVDNPFAITGDAQGNIFLSGCFMQTMTMGTATLSSNGLWDVFTAKILPNGDVAWAVSFGSSDNDRSNDVCLDAAGNIYMYGWYKEAMTVGTATLSFLGGYDIFLIKLQPNGVPVWGYSFGGNSIDVGAAMGMDAVGNLYLMGDFWSPDFAVGNLNLSPTSGNDIFHIRLGTETTAVEDLVAKTASLLHRLSAPEGQMAFEARQAGHIRVLSMNGQMLLDKTIESGEPVYLSVPNAVVGYRFESDGKVEKGKWGR